MFRLMAALSYLDPRRWECGVFQADRRADGSSGGTDWVARASAGRGFLFAVLRGMEDEDAVGEGGDAGRGGTTEAVGKGGEE